MPDVVVVQRTSDCLLVVVGSDGLWEKMPEEKMVYVCKENATSKNAAEKICKELVSVAKKCWDTVVPT